jgi:hypothetical protein
LKARDQQFVDPERGPLVTARFGVALLLIVVGIAWVAYSYVQVRTGLDPAGGPEFKGSGFLGKIDRWNYVIGFGLFMLGLVISAHPSTPLGRGRGVVVGMLGCFLVGLAWICMYYVMSGQSWGDKVPVFNDLGQSNLMVGIAFMAVGFTFATRWE